MTDKKLPKYLTKGGPDNDCAPGEVSTNEWFVEQLKPYDDHGNKKLYYDTNILNKGTIAQKAKDKEIYFCSIPFTQVYSEIDGRYHACCFAAESKEHHVENTSLEDWMVHSEYMNSIRKEMLDPNSDLKAVNEICKRCRQDEERYGRSRRTNCMKIHSNDYDFWKGIDKTVEYYQKTGEYWFKERVLEIQLKIFGSECNLDCYMCSHANSTTRQNVAFKGGVWNDGVFWKMEGKYKDFYEKYLKQVSKDKTEGMIEQAIKLAPYTRSIKIIGGEPLIMKKHYEFLQALIDTGHAKDIIVKYQTNLTKTKKGKHNIFDYIPKFKKVAMVASVDGIGKTIEYMRRRTNWSEVEENINICGKYDNVNVDFNGLVSFLSVMRFYEVVDWCKNNPVIDQLNWAMLETPRFLRPQNLPNKIKEKLIPKYKDWPDIQAALELDPLPDFNIQDVFDYLLLADKYYKGTKWEMNLFDVFPELEEFYDPDEPRSNNQKDLFKQMDEEMKQSEERRGPPSMHNID